MADTNNGLPEGTDTVIEGGGAGGSSGGTGRSGTVNQGGSTSSTTNATGGRTSTTAGDTGTNSLITGQTTDAGRSIGGGNSGGNSSPAGNTDDSANKSGIRGMLSSAGTKARDEAASRARGFVGQGLSSGSATLGNVASIIEDTVEQIGQRLGPQYGDYARTASQTIQRYATTLENKDPDELVDDVRDIVRKSPGAVLTGAAIIGFGLARLLRAGIAEGSNGGSTSASSGSTGATTIGAGAGSTTASTGTTTTGGAGSTTASTGTTGTGATGGSTGRGGAIAGTTQPKA